MVATSWKRVVRFRDVATLEELLGEPVDPRVDVGLAVSRGEPVEVFLIEGDIFDGRVTDRKAVIKEV
jgi:hypothetical protein